MTVLTGEYETIKRETRKFAEKEVVPIAHDLYNEGAEIPMEIIRKLADLGYFAMAIPEQYGGLGMDTLTITLVTEELSRAWLSVGSVMTRMLIAGGLILNGGTEEQKERWLPGIASGDVLPAAAFTEPNAGSDTAGMQLRAVKQGDAYVLNGANLDHLRQPRQPDDRPGPHRSRPEQAARGTVDVPGRKNSRQRFYASTVDRQAHPDHRLLRHEILQSEFRGFRSTGG